MGGRTDKSDGERGPERSPLIHPFLRDHSSHSAPGIPGDDVDVQVHHRLADVEAVGVEPFVEEDFCLPEEGEEGALLFVRRVEEVRDVAVGDDEEVAGADRVPVNSGRSRGRWRGRSLREEGCRRGSLYHPCLVPPDVD